MNQRFPKNERLSSKRLIDQLFDRKNEQVQSLFVYPFRVVWILKEEKIEESATTIPQILVSVSKRSFKRAVDRNLLKRRIREAYRLNKNQLLQKTINIPHCIGFLYIGKVIEDYAVIEKKIKDILTKI